MIHDSGTERMRCSGRLEGRRDRESDDVSIRLRVASLQGADGADCLTKGQVESAKAMTSPVRIPDSRTKS